VQQPLTTPLPPLQLSGPLPFASQGVASTERDASLPAIQNHDSRTSLARPRNARSALRGAAVAAEAWRRRRRAWRGSSSWWRRRRRPHPRPRPQWQWQCRWPLRMCSSTPRQLELQPGCTLGLCMLLQILLAFAFVFAECSRNTRHPCGNHLCRSYLRLRLHWSSNNGCWLLLLQQLLAASLGNSSTRPPPLLESGSPLM